MDFFTIASILLTITALLSYCNARFLKLPTTIGLTLIAVLISLGLMGIDALGWSLDNIAIQIFDNINFSKTVLNGMLSFMLFAGALHIDMVDLKKEKTAIFALASLGIILSTLLTGALLCIIVSFLKIQLSLLFCFVFGALISPTDPIGVLAILKKTKIPKSLAITITGESLFNDGIGVVAFLATFAFASGAQNWNTADIISLLSRQILGGCLLGVVLGWVTNRLLQKITEDQIAVLLTLALATGGYTLALHADISAPITIVVAGLMIGSRRRAKKIAEGGLDQFWELVDGIMNAVLFVLIGLFLSLLPIDGTEFLAGFLAILAVLLGRLLSVALILHGFRLKLRQESHALRTLTWGGIRGSVSIALALSIPLPFEREKIVTITYIVVAFSILVQGLTLKRAL